jgi:hypothetical protein
LIDVANLFTHSSMAVLSTLFHAPMLVVLAGPTLCPNKYDREEFAQYNDWPRSAQDFSKINKFILKTFGRSKKGQLSHLLDGAYNDKARGSRFLIKNHFYDFILIKGLRDVIRQTWLRLSSKTPEKYR